MAVAGSEKDCVDLYRETSCLPGTYTRGVIATELQMSLNGPISAQHSNIISGIDNDSGKRYMLKLLAIPVVERSVRTEDLRRAIDAEVEASRNILGLECEGLVKCTPVEVTITRSNDLPVSAGTWRALKMQPYFSSLRDVPQLSEKLLKAGFRRIRTALDALHGSGFVHMDIKPDNVFVDGDGNWDLGDFGSTRKVGNNLWSWSVLYNPYKLETRHLATPAMDMVLLCVLIAFERDKQDQSSLFDKTENVQTERVLSSLRKINDAGFRDELVDLFSRCVEEVEQWLK
jgi:serine/threonine protein kinase